MGVLLNRRRYMGGAFLPYDAEIEYLAVGSSIGPYINTGYAWTSNDIEIDIEFMQTGSGNANTGLFGSQKVGRDTNWGIQYWHAQAGYSIRHYIGSTSTVYSWNATQNTIHHFIGKVNSDYTWKITVDGVDHTGTWTGSVYDNVTNVALFTLSNGSDFTTRRTNNVRVYSFKLTDNSVVVRDMIPVRIGTVGYMYDKVSGQLFGNAGTGDFVLGPDKIIIMTKESNPEVLAVCYAQGWCASPDYMTKSEAERVTDISHAFVGNTSITTFNELVYFTSITAINPNSYMAGDIGFTNCTNLREITFPPNLKTLGYAAFKNCTSLTTINNLENIEYLGIPRGTGNAFWGCSSLEEINLPNLIGTDGDSAYRACTSLKKLTIGAGCTEIGYASLYQGSTPVMVMLGTVPPTLGNLNTTASMVYVPDEALNDYATATNWDYYYNNNKLKPISELPL